MNKRVAYPLILVILVGAVFMWNKYRQPDNTVSAEASVLRFATCADYPPFEYLEKGKLVGFDIALARLVAQSLGKKATFQDMQFPAIFAALSSGMVDAAISTITITPERQQQFDFSIPYYTERLALVCKKTQPLHNAKELKGKTIAAQLGTTMEVWLKAHAVESTIVPTDTNPQAIAALLAGRVDAVLIDITQSRAFVQQHPEKLISIPFGQTDSSYGIALEQGSPLHVAIDDALRTLKAQGKIAALKEQYLGNTA